MDTAIALEAVRTKYQLLQPLMTERMRRQWAACEAQWLGRGGATIVAQATGLSRTTIWAGRRELQRRADHPQEELSPERVRAPGGGRHLVEQDNSVIPHGATRNRLCFGPPRVPAEWPPNFATWVIR